MPPGGNHRTKPAPPATRVVPHNLEAEEALIGAALLSRNALRILATQTQPDDYYRTLHAEIAAICTTIYAEDTTTEGPTPADPITVAAHLDKQGHTEPGGLAALMTLQANTPATSNAARYARIIREHATLRRLITAADQIAELGYATPDDVSGAVQRAQDLIADIGTSSTVDTSRYQNGADWIRDTPAGIPAVWGHDDQVLWAQGEPLLVVGPTGAGKTTLTQQVVLARLGVTDQVIGQPVAPTDATVLYLACDRPAQIRRSFRRAIPPEQAHLLDRLVIWEGPPAQDFAKHPRSIIDMATSVGAQTVFIDSLKDVASKLSDDETGAGLNRTMQNAIVEGIEICALHHQRKGQGGVKPKTIEDIYGSVWIPAGCGSVILLWGRAGDLTVELSHLKQPGSPVGPLELVHDHDTATTTVERGPIDALHVLRNNPNGITSADLAQRNSPDGPPSAVDIKRAKRSLDRLVKTGAAWLDKGSKGGPGGTIPDRYHATDQARHAPDEEDF